MRKGMFDVQLAVAQRYVQLHSETKGMQSARELARMMLNYRAATPLNTDLQLQDALRQQREAGAEPLDLIARMLAFLLFLEGRPGAFGGSQRAEDVACGRFVTHAVPRADKRYTAHVYALAGALAREHLGPFAVTLLRKVNADAARVATLRRESMELEA